MSVPTWNLLLLLILCAGIAAYGVFGCIRWWLVERKRGTR